MKLFCIACLGIALASSPALSQGKGKAKGHQREAAAAASAPRAFLPQERRIIFGYYAPSTGNLPPGLAKRGGDLPPGLEKQLRRNGQLPPGLQKRLSPFPAQLEGQLSPLPVGYRRVVMGPWALLINDAANVVVDILDLAHRR